MNKEAPELFVRDRYKPPPKTTDTRNSRAFTCYHNMK
jgi:hypothetical protein